MSTWVVEVRHADTQECRQYGFDRSPVRVGRSPLNELPLVYPFVSHSHGVFHFTDAGVEYVDLGSTNGSFVGTQRLEKNRPMRLDSAAELRIGRLTVRVSANAVSKRTHHSYAFPAMVPDAPSPDNTAPLMPPAPAQPSVSAGGPSVRSEQQPLSVAYAAYRQGFQHVLGALRKELQTVPESQRPAWFATMQAGFPALAHEPEFVALSAGTLQQPKSEANLARTRSPRPDGGPPRGSPAAQLMTGRLWQIADRCLRSFVELRRGHDHFLGEMGISVSRESTRLSGLTDADAVMKYLLEPNAEPNRVDELSRAFADVMTHQVALLNAALSGARSLLSDLHPERIETQAAGVGVFLGRLVGHDARWEHYRRTHLELLEEKALALALFGKEFARAYTAIMGRRPAPAPASLSADSTPVGLSR
jgi:type VI secretion system protein ImpI